MKHKATPSEVKAIVRSAAILEYLREEFNKKYPDGIPALLEIQTLFSEADEKPFDEAASILVEEAVSDLFFIVEKYK